MLHVWYHHLLRVVQIRGSIPLYWVQDTTSVSPINPKPAIQLQQYDPHYSATRLHFQVISAVGFCELKDISYPLPSVFRLLGLTCQTGGGMDAS